MFSRQGSCKKLSLISCLGCLIIVILIVSGCAYLFNRHGQWEKLVELPENLPHGFPIYQAKLINSINYLPGAQKSRLQEWAALAPKLFSALITAAVEKEENEPLQAESKTSEGIKIRTSIHPKEIISALNTPVTDKSVDTLKLNWQNLTADNSTIISFYRETLTAYLDPLGKSEKVVQILDDNNLIWHKDKNFGSLLITNLAGEKVNLELIINYPHEGKN